jgi:hypothetical protein
MDKRESKFIQCINASPQCKLIRRPHSSATKAERVCKTCRNLRVQCGTLSKAEDGNSRPAGLECGARRRFHDVYYFPGEGPCHWCLETTHTSVLDFSFVQNKNASKEACRATQLEFSKRKQRAESRDMYRCVTSIPEDELSVSPYGWDEVIHARDVAGMFEACNDVYTPIEFCETCLPVLKTEGVVDYWNTYYWEDGR